MTEHAFEEVNGLILANVQDVATDASFGHHLDLFLGIAAQLRIGHYTRRHMSGHIYLGDNLDVTFGSVSHHFTQIIERVVASTTILGVVEKPIA